MGPGVGLSNSITLPLEITLSTGTPTQMRVNTSVNDNKNHIKTGDGNYGGHNHKVARITRGEPGQTFVVNLTIGRKCNIKTNFQTSVGRCDIIKQMFKSTFIINLQIC